MIIGIPVNKDSMEANVSGHFGRTDYFLIYNTENEESKFVVNTAVDSTGGAGIKAAQIIIDNKVQALISPRLGQNASEVIEAQNIKLYQAIKGSIQENIKAFKENTLSPLNDIHEGFHGNVKK